MNKRTLIGSIIGALALVMGAGTQAQSTYSTAVLGLNPAGYWPLNETNAPPMPINITAANSGSLGAAGNGYYGAWYQPSGSQWYLTNNIVMEAGPASSGDQALNCQFTSGQYIILPRNTNGVNNAALTIKPPFSVEAWVKIGTTATRVGYVCSEGEAQLVAGGPNPTNPFYGGTSTNWAGFEIGQYANYFTFDCFETNVYQGKANELDSPKVLTATGGWIYLVCTYDGTTEIMYTNGVQAGTHAVAANGAGLKYVPDPTTPLMIGSGSDAPNSYGDAWTGGIGEVAIYNEVLPSASMQAHYQTAGGTNATFGANYAAAVAADSPILYYRMNDSQSQVSAGYPAGTFPVATNYGTLGTVANGLYQPGTTPGVAGPSFAGFGANSASVAINGWLGAVDVGGGSIPAALNPTGTAPLTVVSWFRTGPADSPARLQDIVGHTTNSYTVGMGVNVSEMYAYNGTNKLDTTGYGPVNTGGFDFNDGQWHMAADISDGTNEYLYLDGALDLSNSVATGINITGSSDDLLLGGDPQYTFANGTGTYNTIRNFDGEVAQVAFWTSALTAAQIQSLINAAQVPLYIGSQPAPSVTVSQGQNVTVSTAIRGSSPAYQWYESGAPVAGQTSATLTFTPAVAGNSGIYYLVATNILGAVTSSVVNVTVYGPPVVTQQTPTVLNIFVGSSPTLQVTANGAGALGYQWNVGGTPIPGATGTSYTLTNIQTSATYGCTITNYLGTNSIAPIAVAVLSDPTAPYPAHVLANGPAAYYRLDEASGTTAYDYVGGNNATYTNVIQDQIPGYDSLSDPTEAAVLFGITTANSMAGNVPSYLNFGVPNGGNAEITLEAWVTQYAYQGGGDCIVGIGYGNGGEEAILDTGNTTTGYLRFLVRNAAGTGSSASSTKGLENDGLWHHVVGVCDEANGKLYLYLDGVQVATGTITANSGLLASSLPLTIGARESGNNNPINYDFEFEGEIDDVAIYNKALTAAQVQADYVASGIPPLGVQVQPSSLSTNAGANVTFTSTIQGGSVPLSYQWYDENNNPISNQTNTSLTLANVQPNQSGNYTLTVTNEWGATNVQANLAVNMGPAQISQDIQPTSVTKYAGTPASFSIGVSGSLPIHYQWYQDGAAVTGATNSTFTFSTVLGTNTYYCSVSNAFSYSEGSGPVISSTATTIGIAPTYVSATNFNSKMKIEFPGYTRSEALQDFPVLVLLSTNLPGFSYAGFASPTGGDLRFADASGTVELPYEIDTWDYTNGVSSIWVQVPSLSGGTNNYIWAYWGNPNDAVPPAYTTNGTVWVPPAFLNQPAYDLVYHLGQHGFPYYDSTLDYPSINGLAPAQDTGVVGTGDYFSRNPWMDAGVVNLGYNFTLSVWANVSSGVSDIQCLWANGSGVSGSSEVFFYVNDYKTDDGALALVTGDGSTSQKVLAPAGTVTLDQWHLLTATVNGSSTTATLYLDGNPVQTGITVNDFPTNTDMDLGRDTGGSYNFLGSLDEARINGGIEDSNWVWASYLTVASNSVFSAYSTVTNTIVLPITLTIQNTGNQVILTWPAGTLQSASQLTGPFNTVAGATSPYTNTVSGSQNFYRVQAQF